MNLGFGLLIMSMFSLILACATFQLFFLLLFFIFYGAALATIMVKGRRFKPVSPTIMEVSGPLSNWRLGMVGFILIVMPLGFARTDLAMRGGVTVLTLSLIGGCWVAGLLYLKNSYARFRGSNTELISKGNAAYRKGSFKEAVEYFDGALKNNPSEKKAWNNKGVVLHKLGQFEEADKCFDQVRPKENERRIPQV